MKILVTGAAGFLGRRLAQRLLSPSDLAVERLLLVDIVAPPPLDDARATSLQSDLAENGVAERLLGADIDAIVHLAAVVSGEAEANFPLGMRVNIDATRRLLDAAQATGRCPRFVFASSVAVFGQPLPEVVGEDTAPSPKSSYGMQKAVGELLVGDYSRRGFIDGRAPRLPTISVRPGPANRATSSFASGIIREPLNGEPAVCPVDRDLVLWLSSPATVIENLIHCLTLPGSMFGERRTLNLPGISVSVGEMIGALERVAGREVVERIEFRPDPVARRIVSGWPGRFDVSRAESLGFRRDGDFEGIIRAYIADRAAAAG
jgi:D-erythronate 2-dehydrogenase